MCYLYGASACLLGYRCRYDGLDKRNVFFVKVMLTSVVPICPEVFGGLSIPRPPCRIVGGNGFDVLDRTAEVEDCCGKNVTKPFIDGAYHVYQIFKDKGISKCFLKSGSPSCGFDLFLKDCGLSIEGSMDGEHGTVGVTAALLFYMGVDIQVVP